MHSLPMTCSKNDLYSVSIELVPDNAISCMFEATPCHWPFITKYTVVVHWNVCFKLTVARSNYRYYTTFHFSPIREKKKKKIQGRKRENRATKYADFVCL